MGRFKLSRIYGPILSPISHHSWESRAVFNPGIARDGEIIHMLYRAVVGANFSSIGHAKLNTDGFVVDRLSYPVIVSESEIEKQGCEDPRIVFFDKKYYIFYTGFDGKDIPNSANTRVMLAETMDFISFRKIGMIGPDVQDKDAMIFPEKIGNKIVFIHRIIPNIQIAFFDSMEELINPENSYWPCHLQNLEKHTLLYREYEWESMKIGAGPPPIKTEAGWLLIYHGVDRNKVYRAGAALLDEKNPNKVIARLPYPILEPETEYEKYGDVNMVVFPEGITLKDDYIRIYYGAADKVIGLAEGNLLDMIDDLWRHKI
jgi:predicted GH43/DUF377 family glycosyl hydrolase